MDDPTYVKYEDNIYRITVNEKNDNDIEIWKGNYFKKLDSYSAMFLIKLLNLPHITPEEAGIARNLKFRTMIEKMVERTNKKLLEEDN